MFKESDGCDTTLLMIGLFTSCIFGSALPGFMLVFGEMIDAVGSVMELEETRKFALI